METEVGRKVKRFQVGPLPPPQVSSRTQNQSPALRMVSGVRGHRQAESLCRLHTACCFTRLPLLTTPASLSLHFKPSNIVSPRGLNFPLSHINSPVTAEGQSRVGGGEVRG
ncbi:hypothetical protein ACOMHN_012047 [Nucella lapillus]